MPETRAMKISTFIFLLAIFIMLAVFMGGWLYKIYIENTHYSKSKTDEALNCNKYYYKILQDTVSYENGVIRFDVENYIGAEFKTLVVQSETQQKELNITIGQETTLPVEVEIEAAERVRVYPLGCENNYKEIII
jgi:hypothetical protein